MKIQKNLPEAMASKVNLLMQQTGAEANDIVMAALIEYFRTRESIPPQSPLVNNPHLKIGSDGFEYIECQVDGCSNIYHPVNCHLGKE